jgi:hypothetical protein
VCLDAGAIAGGAPRKTGPAGIGPKKCGPHAVGSLVQSLPALFFAPILPVSFLIPPGFLRFPLAPQNRNAYKFPCVSGVKAEAYILNLPDWERAEIDPAKIRNYLLSSTHPVGRFKSPFFAALGYTEKDWHVLQAGLREIVRQGTPVHAGRNDYGEKYTVWGRLKTPAGFSRGITTVWIVLLGEDVPRFVTAYPGEEK